MNTGSWSLAGLVVRSVSRKLFITSMVTGETIGQKILSFGRGITDKESVFVVSIAARETLPKQVFSRERFVCLWGIQPNLMSSS